MSQKVISAIQVGTSRSHGGKRQVIIGNGVAWTGVAYAFQAKTDCNPTVMTSESATGDLTDGNPYPAGTVWHSRFTAITLPAGEYGWVYIDQE